MRTRPHVLAALALLVALVVSGCGTTQGADAPDGRLAVVATTTQLADFTARVGGDEVRVVSILKPNADAHDFEPSPADIDAIAQAEVLVTNGLGLESWLDQTIKSSGFDGRRVTASDGITPIEGDAHADEHAGEEGGEHAGEEGGEHAGEEAGEHAVDPHVWQDPRNAKVMTANIARALAEARPEAAEAFRANQAAYARELDALDADIAAQIAALPNKKLVTNHESFNYYARRYGLDYVGSVIPSFDTSAELSAREVTDLVARIRRTGTKVVFSETSLPPGTARTVAAEAGVKVVAGDGALYGDSLGPKGSPGETYLGALRHNTRTIVDNLR